MSLSVKHITGKTFEVTCRSHKIITDQPKAEGGTNKGMTPVELLNAAIASCAAFYAITFLSHRTINLSGLGVRCSWQYSETPHRIGSIDLTINIPSALVLTEPEKKGLLRSVEHCTIKNTLEHPPIIRIVTSTK